MARRQLHQCRIENVEPVVEAGECRHEPKDEARVDDVLAGGAPVQVRGVGLTDGGAELAQELRHHDAVPREAEPERAPVGAEIRAGRGDAGRGLGRDQAGIGLGGREGCLDPQHGGEVGRIGEERLEFGIAGQGGQECGGH